MEVNQKNLICFLNDHFHTNTPINSKLDRSKNGMLDKTMTEGRGGEEVRYKSVSLSDQTQSKSVSQI